MSSSVQGGTGVFTRFLRRLEPGAAPPKEEDFVELLQALRRGLKRELRRRHLWSVPPGRLGIVGSPNWTSPSAREDALEELAIDCYEYIFVLRLRSLRAQLLHKDNIDGLIARNIGNYLYERQKKYDPLGFRVYEIVHAAVALSISNNVFRVRSGASAAPEVRNESELEAVEPAPVPVKERVETILERATARWADELLPELITARGPARPRIVEELSYRLGELPQMGVRRFRFGPLIDLFKRHVRQRWAAVARPADGETALELVDQSYWQVLRIVRPDSSFEERRDLDRISSIVARAAQESDDVTRRHLAQLWEFLRVWALDATEQTLPSNVKLERLLGIPRKRIPALLALLAKELQRSVAADCEGVGGRLPSPPQEPPRRTLERDA